MNFCRWRGSEYGRHAARMDLFGQPGQRRLCVGVGDLCEPLAGGAGDGGVSGILDHIRPLVGRGAFKITEHAFVELLKDDLIAEEVIAGLPMAVAVEEYPDYHKGPSVLVLQSTPGGEPLR